MESQEQSYIVFVTGAGASVDFSLKRTMPVGSQLAEQIESMLRSETSLANTINGPISEALARAAGGYSADHYLAMKRICDGIQSKDSIDDFINEWSDYPKIVEIAKMCIAERILAGERGCEIAGLVRGDPAHSQNLRTIRKSWLGTIVLRANPSVRRRDLARVFKGIKFITFNYDRCIEKYIHDWANIVNGMNPIESGNIVSEIGVHHVYGDIGDYRDGDGLGFGGNGEGLWRVSERIRTYNEECNSDDLRKIRGIVSQASAIIFLGCAYHEQNMKMIFGDKMEFAGKIWGTTLGMRPSAKLKVKEYLELSGSEVKLFDAECAELMDQWYEEILRV